MPLGISYMGTKRQLASAVAAIVDESPDGPFLDLFSGMCSVATEVQRTRPVWLNDLQQFAAQVAECHFCAGALPPQVSDAAETCGPAYYAHKAALLHDLKDLIREEETSLSALDQIGVYKPLSEIRTRVFSLLGESRSHALFSSDFSFSYFGLAQAVDVDAIRYAVDEAYKLNQLSLNQHRWLILALCRALARTATTTGHFAQPLSPKASNMRRFIIQRRRSVWREWLESIAGLRPIGSTKWRSGNRHFNLEANSLLHSLSLDAERPTVIYADPPYTSDQYSRFYHVFETLLRYDYPEPFGVGRYRSDRAISTFSLKAGADGSIRKLISLCAGMGSELVLSYPTNGLLRDSRDRIPEIFVSNYGRAPKVTEIEHTHSTMGGSKGVGKTKVMEVLYHGAH